MPRLIPFTVLVVCVMASGAHAGGGLFSDDYGMHLIDHRYPDYFANPEIAAAVRGRAWYPPGYSDCDCIQCQPLQVPMPPKTKPDGRVVPPENVIPEPVRVQARSQSTTSTAKPRQTFKVWPDAAALMPALHDR